MNIKNTNQNSTGMELDQLLSSFFKAEMPDPFPKLKLPVAARAEMPMPASRESLREVRESRERQPISKSRLSLAVSVALLLGGCWYLSGQIGKAPERTNIGKGASSAHVNKELQKAMEDAKKAGNMP